MQRVQLLSPVPALWRAPGVLQVGLEAPALVLAPVPRQLRDAVALLAQPKTPAELAALLPRLDRGWIDWLLAQLEAAGRLITSDRPATSEVRVVGSGPLAEAVTDALKTGTGTADRLNPAAFVSELDRAGHAAGPALVVLAASSLEPDRSLTDALFRRGWPHLIVRLEPDRAVVGPLVVPGRTPCVRCGDLSRCHLDPTWPHLLAQLCLTHAAPAPALTRWAAATALAQASAWLAGRLPEASGASLELVLPDFRLGARQWPAHPACGCLMPLV